MNDIDFKAALIDIFEEYDGGDMTRLEAIDRVIDAVHAIRNPHLELS